MMITLPDDLASRVQAAVQAGRFASVDDAMAEAARLLLGKQDHGQSDRATDGGSSPDLFLGSMSEDAELIDEIVAEVYRQRWEGARREAAP